MKKVFRDQTAETKAAYRITEDADDEAWVYCGACSRAVKQGDCVLSSESAGSLECPYEDCTPGRNIAFDSLYGWDAYRQMHGGETSDWPDAPTAGVCYERRDAGR